MSTGNHTTCGCHSWWYEQINFMKISADLKKLPYNRYPVEVGSILLQYILKHLQSCHTIKQKILSWWLENFHTGSWRRGNIPFLLMMSNRTECDFVFKSASRINERSLTLKEIKESAYLGETKTWFTSHLVTKPFRCAPSTVTFCCSHKEKPQVSICSILLEINTS